MQLQTVSPKTGQRFQFAVQFWDSEAVKLRPGGRLTPGNKVNPDFIK
jgi:hypothetical protein